MSRLGYHYTVNKEIAYSLAHAKSILKKMAKENEAKG